MNTLQLDPLRNNDVLTVSFVTGTTLNYFLDDRINKAEILFPGVGCFLVAVCLGSAVHSSNTADNSAKLKDSLREGNIGKNLQQGSTYRIT